MVSVTACIDRSSRISTQGLHNGRSEGAAVRTVNTVQIKKFITDGLSEKNQKLLGLMRVTTNESPCETVIFINSHGLMSHPVKLLFL